MDEILQNSLSIDDICTRNELAPQALRGRSRQAWVAPVSHWCLPTTESRINFIWDVDTLYVQGQPSLVARSALFVWKVSRLDLQGLPSMCPLLVLVGCHCRGTSLIRNSPPP